MDNYIKQWHEDHLWFDGLVCQLLITIPLIWVFDKLYLERKYKKEHPDAL